MALPVLAWQLDRAAEQPGDCGWVGAPSAIAPIHGAETTDPPRSLCCGESHSALLTAGGAIFTWGTGSDGQLGRPTSESGKDVSAEPRPVRALASLQIVSVACGARHTLALSSAGAVWAWGCGTFGALGLGPEAAEQQRTPQPVPELAHRVTAIACGTYHSLALVSSPSDAPTFPFSTSADQNSASGMRGDRPSRGVTGGGAATSVLWTWGWSRHGQLGDGSDGGHVFSPRPLPLLQLQQQNGGVDACGRAGGDGAAGEGSGTDARGRVGTAGAGGSSPVLSESTPSSGLDSPDPAAVPQSSHTAIASPSPAAATQPCPAPATAQPNRGWAGPAPVSIASGAQHCLAIDTAGSLVSWGANEAGQLGLGDTSHRRSPSRLSPTVAARCFKGARLIAVRCGRKSNLALTAEGNVFAWGQRLGAPSRAEPVSLPTPLPTLRHVVSLSCGARYAVATTASGALFLIGGADAPVALPLPPGIPDCISVACGGSVVLAICGPPSGAICGSPAGAIYGSPAGAICGSAAGANCGSPACADCRTPTAVPIGGNPSQRGVGAQSCCRPNGYGASRCGHAHSADSCGELNLGHGTGSCGEPNPGLRGRDKACGNGHMRSGLVMASPAASSPHYSPPVACRMWRVGGGAAPTDGGTTGAEGAGACAFATKGRAETCLRTCSPRTRPPPAGPRPASPSEPAELRGRVRACGGSIGWEIDAREPRRGGPRPGGARLAQAMLGKSTPGGARPEEPSGGGSKPGEPSSHDLAGWSGECGGVRERGQDGRAAAGAEIGGDVKGNGAGLGGARGGTAGGSGGGSVGVRIGAATPAAPGQPTPNGLAGPTGAWLGSSPLRSRYSGSEGSSSINDARCDPAPVDEGKHHPNMGDAWTGGCAVGDATLEGRNAFNLVREGPPGFALGDATLEGRHHISWVEEGPGALHTRDATLGEVSEALSQLDSIVSEMGTQSELSLRARLAQQHAAREASRRCAAQLSGMRAELSRTAARLVHAERALWVERVDRMEIEKERDRLGEEAGAARADASEAWRAATESAGVARAEAAAAARGRQRDEAGVAATARLEQRCVDAEAMGDAEHCRAEEAGARVAAAKARVEIAEGRLKAVTVQLEESWDRLKETRERLEAAEGARGEAKAQLVEARARLEDTRSRLDATAAAIGGAEARAHAQLTEAGTRLRETESRVETAEAGRREAEARAREQVAEAGDQLKEARARLEAAEAAKGEAETRAQSAVRAAEGGLIAAEARAEIAEAEAAESESKLRAMKEQLNSAEAAAAMAGAAAEGKVTAAVKGAAEADARAGVLAEQAGAAEERVVEADTRLARAETRAVQAEERAAEAEERLARTERVAAQEGARAVAAKARALAGEAMVRSVQSEGEAAMAQVRRMAAAAGARAGEAEARVMATTAEAAAAEARAARAEARAAATAAVAETAVAEVRAIAAASEARASGAEAMAAAAEANLAEAVAGGEARVGAGVAKAEIETAAATVAMAQLRAMAEAAEAKAAACTAAAAQAVVAAAAAAAREVEADSRCARAEASRVDALRTLSVVRVCYASEKIGNATAARGSVAAIDMARRAWSVWVMSIWADRLFESTSGRGRRGETEGAAGAAAGGATVEVAEGAAEGAAVKAIPHAPSAEAVRSVPLLPATDTSASATAAALEAVAEAMAVADAHAARAGALQRAAMTVKSRLVRTILRGLIRAREAAEVGAALRVWSAAVLSMGRRVHGSAQGEEEWESDAPVGEVQRTMGHGWIGWGNGFGHGDSTGGARGLASLHAPPSPAVAADFLAPGVFTPASFTPASFTPAFAADGARAASRRAGLDRARDMAEARAGERGEVVALLAERADMLREMARLRQRVGEGEASEPSLLKPRGPPPAAHPAVSPGWDGLGGGQALPATRPQAGTMARFRRPQPASSEEVLRDLLREVLVMKAAVSAIV